MASIVETELASGPIPGIALLVEKERQIVSAVASGYRQLQPTREPMLRNTMFDLASLTKPLATALLVLIAATRNQLALDREIRTYLPELPDSTGRISVEQLLLHTGGLRPEPDLYKAFPDPQSIDRDHATALLLSEEPVTAPGAEVIYSCTGYLILGVMLERVFLRRLSRLYAEFVTEPCEIPDLAFTPGVEYRNRIAASEFCRWRKRWICGEVHDENAFTMGGDAGNAGLFGTVDSVRSLLSMFDTGGLVGDYRLLPEDTTRLMRTCLTPVEKARRAIGFRMQDQDAPMGTVWSESSFGHTGFTGTSVWVDPDRELKVVMCTNRVHAGREATAEAILAFRRTVHSGVFEHWG